MTDRRAVLTLVIQMGRETSRSARELCRKVGDDSDETPFKSTPCHDDRDCTRLSCNVIAARTAPCTQRRRSRRSSSDFIERAAKTPSAPSFKTRVRLKFHCGNVRLRTFQPLAYFGCPVFTQAVDGR